MTLRWTAICALLVACTAAAALAPPSAGASLLAARSQCSGQQNVRAPERKQEDALRCLIDHARSQRAKPNRALERAAGRKAGDVVRCGLSHTACGRPFDSYAKRYGYASGTSGWRLGENLAWGKGKRSSARRAMKAWLGSPPHRQTMLSGAFEHYGIGLKRGGFGGVWVLQLGCRGC